MSMSVGAVGSSTTPVSFQPKSAPPPPPPSKPDSDGDHDGSGSRGTVLNTKA
jgi:hypothetical protein